MITLITPKEFEELRFGDDIAYLIEQDDIIDVGIGAHGQQVEVLIESCALDEGESRRGKSPKDAMNAAYKAYYEEREFLYNAYKQRLKRVE